MEEWEVRDDALLRHGEKAKFGEDIATCNGAGEAGGGVGVGDDVSVGGVGGARPAAVRIVSSLLVEAKETWSKQLEPQRSVRTAVGLEGKAGRPSRVESGPAIFT